MELNHLRQEYKRKELSRNLLSPNPIVQFRIWMTEAIDSEIIEPNAFALATANKESRPTCRHVLLKQFDEHGFCFFTNYESRKAMEIEQNPQVFATFWWKELERQVSIEGTVQKTSKEESALYFARRTRGSQLAAWISRQSAVIDDREVLEQKFAKLEMYYKNKEIPLPPFWGGYRIIPESVEFWQGRSDRLHDRFLYRREGNSWSINRLSP
jgi:pyridoxamine 5'-phosphate oxidase